MEDVLKKLGGQFAQTYIVRLQLLHSSVLRSLEPLGCEEVDRSVLPGDAHPECLCILTERPRPLLPRPIQ
ncbi:hypothetical protein EYF80_063956 [Liparis tanakae]|uniref:Uncharacterized protein n=1 Tax=Liparis tanakae TaxID=230148 RepID=A0A4Z2EAR1_9TELE|nr:hypothetical protein EYF80_063956 [Liparis tanakae]